MSEPNDNRLPHPSRLKFIVGGVIVAACIVALVAKTTGASLDFYSSVGEFLQRVESGKAGGRGTVPRPYTEVSDSVGAGHRSPPSGAGAARVRGMVQAGSVQHDAAGLDTEFILVDGKATLPVFYHGVLPATFEPGSDLVVQGTYDAARKVFVASQLMFKCPSKYESKKGTY